MFSESLYTRMLISPVSDNARKSMQLNRLSRPLKILQEIITGAVPYFEYKSDVGIYRAIDKKQPPRRPKVLPGPEERAVRMWDLLLRCWDHDPSARPDALLVLESVSAK
jgi:hypothetical protein